MIFATPALSDEVRRVHDEIDELRRNLSYGTQTRRWSGFLARVMLARAIQGSNSIEGYNVTIDDAIAAANNESPIDAAPEQQTWAAITGYRDAMTYVLQLADDPHFEQSATLIRSLHYIMQKYDPLKHPGQWRPGPIFVRNDATGETVYEGPPADRVPSLIGNLIGSMNASDGVPIMVRAAMAHLNLVMVHPFSDGNGRMARILQTLVLAREGILVPQFCSIEEYLGKYRQEYYDVLAAVGQGSWHPENDAVPWIRFCLTIHFRQATTLLRRTRELARLWEVLEGLTADLNLPDRLASVLADAALGFRVRNALYRTQAGISMNQASTDLARLVAAGLLQPSGAGPSRFYLSSERLRGIREHIREPKAAIEDPFKQKPRLQVSGSPKQQVLPGFWLDEDT